MVAQLRVDVPSVMRELDVALGILAEAKIVSRYRKIFKGKGLEFEDFREYTTSDDASKIDWKASMRANKLLMREFREERDLDVYFLVDVSAGMFFGSTKKLKHEYAAELVTALMHFVLQSGDKIGLVLFNEKVVKFIEPGKGTNHFYITLKGLLNPEFYGGGHDIQTVLEFLLKIIKKESLAFMVSDFLGLREGWESSMKLSSGKIDGIALMVRDPVEKRLPEGVGQVVITDPLSHRQLLINCNDEKERLEYETFMKKGEEEFKDAIKKCHWDIIEVDTSESFVRPIIEFLRRREMIFR